LSPWPTCGGPRSGQVELAQASALRMRARARASAQTMEAGKVRGPGQLGSRPSGSGWQCLDPRWGARGRAGLRWASSLAVARHCRWDWQGLEWKWKFERRGRLPRSCVAWRWLCCSVRSTRVLATAQVGCSVQVHERERCRVAVLSERCEQGRHFAQTGSSLFRARAAASPGRIGSVGLALGRSCSAPRSVVRLAPRSAQSRCDG